MTYNAKNTLQTNTAIFPQNVTKQLNSTAFSMGPLIFLHSDIHPTIHSSSGTDIKQIFSKVGPWEISHCWLLMLFYVPTNAKPGLAFKVPLSCQESKKQLTNQQHLGQCILLFSFSNARSGMLLIFHYLFFFYQYTIGYDY